MPDPVANIRSDLAAVVRAIVSDVDRRVAREVVVGRGVERLMALYRSDEIPSERARRENAAALGEMAALGNTRDAAMKVARRWSPDDPHQQEMLAQRFRRLRRSQK